MTSDSDIPPQALDSELMARAKTIVTGLDQTVRNDSTRGSALFVDGDTDALPLLDVTTDAPGDLQVVRLLGSGGMGQVKLARQRALQRDVALKMVNPEDASPTTAGALLREGVVTGCLEHPNIVPVHMLGMDRGGRPVIVMKRVEGVPWSRLEQDDARQQRSVWSGDPRLRHLEVFLQVCSAVSYSHARGYVHRDIKPANVMIGTFGEVYLLDWGIATRIGTPSFPSPPDEEVIPMPTGTATYLAPEMIYADGIIDERTDVFLLGATLHRMLTGRPRHRGKNLYEVLAQALRSEPHVYDDDFPAELAAICNRATAAAPGDRYQSAASLREAVVDYLRHKSSLDLASEAEKLLVHFETLAADASNGARARSSFAECRFAFRHALREWPGNLRARSGLRRSLELMITTELDQDHLDAAEGLLSELQERTPALEERIGQAQQARADERERMEGLRELAYQLDPEVASAPRALLVAILAVVSVAILAAGLLGFSADDVHARAIWTLPPLFIVFLGFAVFRREALFSNAASYRLMAMLAVTLATFSLHRLLGYVARPLFTFQLSGDLLLLATGGACLAVVANRWVFAAVGVWALGACALVFYPGEPLHIFGPSSALGVAVLALVWWKRPEGVTA
jgi:serine/threonine protein kinase